MGGGGGFAPNFALSSHGGGGGEYFDKNAYEAANKNLNDGHYEKNNGVRGEAYDYGQEGYHQGKLGEKNVKEDSGFYKNFDGGKKAHEDGKSYHGGQHFNQEGFYNNDHNNFITQYIRCFLKNKMKMLLVSTYLHYR